VGVLEVERIESVKPPQANMTIVLLAEAEGTPSAAYKWKPDQDILSEREAAILKNVAAGEVCPLSVIGPETGEPPAAAEIEAAHLLVEKYTKK
jgi:hypothetical protein